MCEKIQELANKLMDLERKNPIRLAEFKGRLDAIYEMEGCNVKCEPIPAPKGCPRTNQR